jgi:hypothetical protein
MTIWQPTLNSNEIQILSYFMHYTNNVKDVQHTVDLTQSPFKHTLSSSSSQRTVLLRGLNSKNEHTAIAAVVVCFETSNRNTVKMVQLDHMKDRPFNTYYFFKNGIHLMVKDGPTGTWAV